MNRLLTILVVTFTVAFAAYGQDSIDSLSATIYPNFSGQSLKMIRDNTNWLILKQAVGDLNDDGIQDAAIVLQTKDSIKEKRCNSCYLIYHKARILLILLSNGRDTTVVFQNNTFIARPDEGGMIINLEPNLNIKQNKLTIDYQFTRGYTSYTFKLLQKNFDLVAAISTGASQDSISNLNFNFETMTLIDTEEKIGEDSSMVDTIHLPLKKMKQLSEMKTMYDWEVVKDIFL